MNAEISEGLERAMRAAAAAGGQGGTAVNDPMSLFMQVLPTLLEKWEERQAVGEEEQQQQQEGIEDLRKQVRFVRKQLSALVQSHNGMLEEMRLMRELQSAMVAHLARVQILDLDDDFAGGNDPSAGADGYPADLPADDFHFAGTTRAERDALRRARAAEGHRPPRARPRRP